jgi:hydroxymethylglutaryl-CoA reductase (NADPH)
MSASFKKTKKVFSIIERYKNIDQLIQQIEQKGNEEIDRDPIPMREPHTKEGQKNRINYLREKLDSDFDYIEGIKQFDDHSSLTGNIENYIGMTQIPTGIAGPLRVHGTSTGGDYYVPLATSEGALVASYHRGAKACTVSGGVTSICLTEGVQRSPLFKFSNLTEVGKFLIWTVEHLDKFEDITSDNSRFASLEDISTNVEGNNVILTFEYTTGDAAGQNMVTICTEAICRYIIEHCPVKPEFWFVESNYSGDKKASAVSFSNVRGKKVTSEVILPREVVSNVLKATPEEMAQYWLSSTLAVVQSGTIGAQGHFANGLAALFLATGQDVACVSEAAVGITRMEVTEDGGLYAAVTMPNLIVGTVGGGTHLPTQQECLKMMGCSGPGTARKYAEICGALLLAGELSIAAALSVGHFTNAHQKLGRKK